MVVEEAKEALDGIGLVLAGVATPIHLGLVALQVLEIDLSQTGDFPAAVDAQPGRWCTRDGCAPPGLALACQPARTRPRPAPGSRSVPGCSGSSPILRAPSTTDHATFQSSRSRRTARNWPACLKIQKVASKRVVTQFFYRDQCNRLMRNLNTRCNRCMASIMAERNAHARLAFDKFLDDHINGSGSFTQYPLSFNCFPLIDPELGGCSNEPFLLS